MDTIFSLCKIVAEVIYFEKFCANCAIVFNFQQSNINGLICYYNDVLPQKNRLNRQKFDYVYRTGENVQADIGYVKFTVTDDKHIACVASKNDFPNNVDRTRVRRRGYAVVSKFLQEIPDGVSLIWFLPKSAKKADFSRLETTFQYVIEQIKESIAN